MVAMVTDAAGAVGHGPAALHDSARQHVDLAPNYGRTGLAESSSRRDRPDVQLFPNGQRAMMRKAVGSS